MKNDKSINETITWITSFIDVKTMNVYQKMMILIEKTMKTYSKAMTLSLKNYENILKLNFLMSLLSHTDYLGKYFWGGNLSQ